MKDEPNFRSAIPPAPAKRTVGGTYSVFQKKQYEETRLGLQAEPRTVGRWKLDRKAEVGGADATGG